MRKLRESRRLRIEPLEQRQLLAAELLGYSVSELGERRTVRDSIGELTFFPHDDGQHGDELWVTDGTARGTRLIGDISPGPASSSISQIEVIGDTAYVSVKSEDGSTQVWQSDGTLDGTRLLADFGSDARGLNIAGSLDVGIIAELNPNSTLDKSVWIVPLNGEAPVNLTTGFDANTMVDVLAFSPTHLLISQNENGLTETGTRDTSAVWISDGTAIGTSRIESLDSVFAEIPESRTQAAVEEVGVSGSAFYLAHGFIDVAVVRIQADSTVSQVVGASSNGSFDHINGQLFLIGSGGYWRLDGDVAQPFILSDPESATSIEQVVSWGDNFVYTEYEHSGFLGTLKLLSPSGEVVVLEDAPPAKPLATLYRFGNFVAYESTLTLESRQLVAYNLETRTSQYLEDLALNERLDTVVAQNSLLFYHVVKSDGTFEKLFESDADEGILQITLDRPSTLYGLSVEEDYLFGVSTSQFGGEIVAIDFDTATIDSIIPLVYTANVTLPPVDSRQIGESHLVYYDGGHIVATDSTEVGTVKYPAPDGGEFVSVGERLAYLTDSGLVWIEVNDDEVSFSSLLLPSYDSDGLNQYAASYESLAIDQSTGELIFFRDGDVWRATANDAGIVAETIVVEDFQQRTIQPITAEELPGHFYDTRIVTENDDVWYGTDGTPQRSGKIDSRSDLIARFGLEPDEDVSSASSNGAIFASVESSASERSYFVERPTAVGLQRFIYDELEGPFLFTTLERVSNGWLLAQAAGSNRQHWFWRDDQAEPVFVSINGFFDEDLGGSLTFWSRSGVVAFDTIANEVIAVSDLVESNTYSPAIGRSGDLVVVQNRFVTDGVSSTTLYLWDGTANGIERIEMPDSSFFADNGLNQTRVSVTDDYFLVANDTQELYRFPRSTALFTATGESIDVNVSSDAVIVSDSSDDPFVHSVPGEQLTIDAVQASRTVRLEINDGEKLPINGLRINLGAASILDFVPPTGEPVQYRFDQNSVEVTLGGRRFYIDHEGDLEIHDLSSDADRNIVLQANGTRVSMGDNEVGTGKIEISDDAENEPTATVFLQNQQNLILLGRGADQAVTIDESFDAFQSVQFVNGAANGDAVNIGVPTGFDVRSGSIGERYLNATNGTIELTLDTLLNPRHNPIRPLDTNGDNVLEPVDALHVINHLALGREYMDSEYFVDTNGDGQVLPLDVLLVINELSRRGLESAEPEQFYDVAIFDWVNEQDATDFDSVATTLLF